jgi:hypothetical protein
MAANTPLAATSPKGQLFTQAIGAGQTVPLHQRGNNCYVLSTTGAINLRARGPGGINIYNNYTTGTGFENAEFNLVEVQNNNGFAVTCSIWVGDVSFIDKRNIPIGQSFANAVKPVYVDPTHAPAAFADVPDISGTIFADINGKNWQAITRVSILISNLDAGNVILVQKLGNHVFNSGAIFAVQPATEIGLAIQGSYSIVSTAGTLNALVSEIYLSIPA